MQLAPTGVTAAGSIDRFLEDIQGPGFVVGTDSLEAIRNQGDAAWLMATGFAVPGEILREWKSHAPEILDGQSEVDARAFGRAVS